ncbi:MAG TPA: glycosyltransferase family 4 protein [Herpetosiphonaceae bacterium]
MRIAQIAPLFESVPPKLYGGTERVVHAVTEELVRRGHDVTLFASGDSQTSAKLVPMWPCASRLDPQSIDPMAAQVAMLEYVVQHADAFDIIHSHVDYYTFPFTRRTTTPILTTLHGRLDIPELRAIFRVYGDVPVASISNSQREPLQHVAINWVGTVYNGICIEHFIANDQPGEYLVFLGRICPEKRPDRAVEIARATGMPLKVAAKIDKVDREYYETQIEPLFADPLVEYVGEVDEQAKAELLRNAYALLFPIDWREPFGLTMAEAMACGTPVIAMRGGSVEEVIVDGETGFVCDSMEQMIAAVPRVVELDRRRCRQRVEEHFSAQAMAARYEAVYEHLLAPRNLPVLRLFHRHRRVRLD